MSGQSIHDQLKSLHRSSFGGVFDIFTFKRLRRSVAFLISLALSAALTLIVLAVNPSTLYVLIKFSLELELSILPNLLGFTLGGFAIIISFGNVELLKALSKVPYTDDKKPSPSYFQKIMAVFAWGILMQAFSLCIAFVVSIAAFLLSQQHFDLEISDTLTHLTNALVLFVISLMGSYSILLIPSFIVNIYGFGQSYHLTFVISELQARKAVPKNKVRLPRKHL